jgi:hypothetical protein
MAQQRVMSAHVPALSGGVVPVNGLTSSNALFYYQDLSRNRLPSFLKSRHEELTSAEKGVAVRTRFFVSWFMRLAHEKHPRGGGSAFHNLFAVYVLKNNEQGRQYAALIERNDADTTVMPAHDAVAGILWAQLKEDRGHASSAVEKQYKTQFASQKRARRGGGGEATSGGGRGGEGAPGDLGLDDLFDDNGNHSSDETALACNEEEGGDENRAMTAAARVVVDMEIERGRLRGGGRGGAGGGRGGGEHGGFVSLQRLASGISSPADYPFDLSGPGDFGLLVGCPTAGALLTQVAGSPQYEDAFMDPDRFFSLDVLDMPDDTFVPCEAFDGAQLRVLGRNSVWAVNVREFSLESSGFVMFASALFPLVLKQNGPVPAVYNCYDPYGTSRPRADGLLPAAMTNIREGFAQEMGALRQASHAGLTLYQAQAKAVEYLRMEHEAGARDPDDPEAAAADERALVLRAEIEAFCDEYAPRRRALVLRGLEMVKNGLTPSDQAPISESSRALGLELERIRAKSEADPAYLKELWDVPRYCFPGLGVHQHAYAYLLNVMCLMRLYCMHTLACMFYIAMASMPWERGTALMPLHLMLVGRPALGKSFFLDIIKSMSFQGAVQGVTTLSTKFFANRPESGCYEGALGGLCMVMQEIYPAMFDTNHQHQGEKATFLKTIMTEQELGVFRTEKNEATGSLRGVRFNLANYVNLVMASNEPVTNSAHQVSVTPLSRKVPRQR